MPILERQEITEAERLFEDAVNYNKRMAKHYARPLRRPHGYGGRLAIIKPDDVKDELKKKGIVIGKQTLRNYEKWGLIPEAKRGSAGRGKGRTTEYPDVTVAEAYASYKELHGDGVRSAPGRVASFRRAILNGEWPGLPTEDIDRKKWVNGLLDLAFDIQHWWVNYSLCKHNLPLPQHSIVTIFPMTFYLKQTPEPYPDMNVELDDQRIAKPYNEFESLDMVEIYITVNALYMFVYQLDRAKKKWIFSHQEIMSINASPLISLAQKQDTAEDEHRRLEKELALAESNEALLKKQLALARDELKKLREELKKQTAIE